MLCCSGPKNSGHSGVISDQNSGHDEVGVQGSFSNLTYSTVSCEHNRPSHYPESGGFAPNLPNCRETPTPPCPLFSLMASPETHVLCTVTVPPHCVRCSYERIRYT